MTPPLLYFMLFVSQEPLPVAPEIAAASIMDTSGSAVRETEPLGEQLRLTARFSTYAKDDRGAALKNAVKWVVYPKSRADRKYVSPDGLDLIIPVGLEPVDIQVILSVGLNNTTDVTDVLVSCGKGPRPPPGPTPVPPGPGPTPIPPDPSPTPPVESKSLYLAVFHSRGVSPDAAILLNDLVGDYGSKLSARGHRVSRFDWGDQSATARMLRQPIAVSLSPVISVWEMDAAGQPRAFLGVFDLPGTTNDIDVMIRRFTAR